MRSPTPAASLERFSRCVLRLGQIARTAPGGAFANHALEALREALGFRFGWCGFVAATRGPYPVMQCVDGIRLPAGFAADLRAISPNDDWAREVASCPSVVHRWHGFDEKDEAVDRFVRRNGMYHGMAQSLREPFGDRLFVIAIYREPGTRPFADHEAELFGHCCRHVGQLWRQHVQDTLGRQAPVDLSRVALVRSDGVLPYAGSALWDLLDRASSHWDGSRLPTGLLAEVAGRPGGSLRLADVHVDVTREAGHLRIAMRDPQQAAPLSPREQRVARLYAAGQSYKEIARGLALSPATVRSYLQTAYGRLGVSNKVQLGHALARHAADTTTDPGH